MADENRNLIIVEDNGISGGKVEFNRYTSHGIKRARVLVTFTEIQMLKNYIANNDFNAVDNFCYSYL